MADTKKKRRRTYLESFHKDQDGKYVYQGDVYTYQGNGEQGGECNLRCELRKLWGWCIVLLGSLAAAGCVTAPGMDNCFYVLLPYAAGLMGGISVCWALCRLTSGGSPLKAYVYEASVKALPARTILTALCAGVCIVGEIVFVLRQGTGEKTISFCIFLVLNVLILLTSIMLRRKIRSMQWTK